MAINLLDNRLVSIFYLSRRAFSQYKAQIVILVILGFFGGLVEGIGVNALIPLFSFALDTGDHGTDLISQMIERFFLFFNIEFSVKFLLIFISILFIVKALITILLAYIKIKITSDYEEKTRNNLFKDITLADWPHLTKQKSGYLETILMIDVPNSAQVLNEISNIIMVLTGLVIYIVVAINISLTITLITLIIGAVLFLVMKPLLYQIKILAYQRTQINKDTTHHVNENIFGIKTVKTMVVGDGVIQKASIYFEKLKKLLVKVSVLKNSITAFIQPVGVIFICLVFAYFYRSPGFNLAVLVAIVYLIQKIFTYNQQFQRTLHNLNDLVPHLRSVLSFEDKSIDRREVDKGNKNFSFQKQINFNEVTFSYDGKKVIFDKINLNIKKGEMVGIIGPSGVGKTTLVDLILRLLKPTEGEILIDGSDIAGIQLSQWRRNIGYVSQDIFLMNDSFANNIRFYDQTITEEEIIEAAKEANIYDFIKNCPQGLDTEIGERGVLLSNGQRQRVVIARVLVRQPQLLVFDEATSALDNESELQIQKVIRKLKGNVTVLVIAHRLQTVMDSDKLIVLDKGKVAEEGAPEKLLKQKDSYFFKVYNIRK